MSIKDYLAKNIDDIKTKRINGVLVKDLAEEYGVNEETMSKFLVDNDIKHRHLLSTDEIAEIIGEYNSHISCQNIGKKHHISAAKVMRILNENNVPIRSNSESKQKYTLNEQYFNAIDSQDKAYILGFLYADGSKSAVSNTITINIQERDVDLLHKINNAIGSNRPLAYIDCSNAEVNRMNQYRLCVSNKVLSEDLLLWGIVPKKEFKLKYPDFLSDKLIRHFIRGYMDGDGNINSSECRWGLTGCYDLLKGISEYIENMLGIHTTLYHHKGKNEVTYELRVAGRRQVKKLLDHLYFNANIFMDRKYNLYQDKYCA